MKECQFLQPAIEDPESKVSETITTISNEIEKYLLSNPNDSILGFSVLRTFFESYVLIMARDKIRAHIRIEEKNNSIDIRFSDDPRREDVFV